MSLPTSKVKLLDRQSNNNAGWHISNGAGPPSGTRVADKAPTPSHRFHRLWLPMVVHVIVFALAYLAAFQLRFEFSVPQNELSIMMRSLPWVVALKLAVFYLFGNFESRWRFVTLSDLAVLIQSAIATSILIGGIDYFFISSYQIPRVVLILDWGATILALGGLRSAARIAREHIWPVVATDSKRPVLVIGADNGGEAVVRSVHSHPALNYRVVGFLDKNAAYHGSRLSGIPFLGSPSEAVLIARKKNVRELFVIAGSLNGQDLQAVVRACRQASIKVKMIPPIDKLLNESYRLQVRDVDINDLLRRDPIQLDTEVIGQMLKGRCVMVTGAGGSIGAEICRQVAQHNPKELVLVERAENNLFQIEQQLLEVAGHVTLHACIADICDEERLRLIFQKYRPAVVFHAAAHKHVPLMEKNAGEAVKNNIFGTKNVAELADESGVDRFILISTDKAVNPTSIMGLSKKFAERCIYSLSQTSRTKFVVVRFGNVLGSSGSVVPLFQEQIRRGGPVTVTHEEMRRFFMTIPEASQLVLQAAAIGEGSEIFVLDMGEPVKIVELAQELIRLSGLSNDDIEIKIVGMRPGEKLSEEISDADERAAPTSHPKLRVIYPTAVDPAEVWRCMDGLAAMVNAPESDIGERLQQLVAADLGLQEPPVGFAAENS